MAKFNYIKSDFLDLLDQLNYRSTPNPYFIWLHRKSPWYKFKSQAKIVSLTLHEQIRRRAGSIANAKTTDEIATNENEACHPFTSLTRGHIRTLSHTYALPIRIHLHAITSLEQCKSGPVLPSVTLSQGTDFVLNGPLICDAGEGG